MTGGLRWKLPAGVCALVSNRQGGASRGAYRGLNLGEHTGDDPRLVAANRAEFGRSLDGAVPVFLRQCHGSLAVKADPSAKPCEADALHTVARGVACTVLTADCLPVLLASCDGGMVCAAHAGWRGLAAQVLENAVAAFNGASLAAYLGPAVGQECYRVGSEVRDKLCPSGQDEDCLVRGADGGWMADLAELARRRLERCGVNAGIFNSGVCTACFPGKYYSVRRDGPQTGRFASAIWIT